MIRVHFFSFLCAISTAVLAESHEGNSFHVLLGGCSIKIKGNIELVYRTDKETSFHSRMSKLSDLSKITTFSYTDFEPEVYSAERFKIVEFQSPRDELKVLKVSVKGTVTEKNPSGLEWAYLHDSKYAFAIVGDLASTYWNLFSGDEDLVECE